MFGEVEAFEFLFFGNPQADGGLESHEDRRGACDGEDCITSNTDGLDSERVLGVRREDADGQRAPDAAGQVDRDCTDRVIDLELVEEHDGSDDQHASDEADHDGHIRVDHICTGRDADQARENAIERHREVWLRADGGVGDHGTDAARCSCEAGGHEREGREGRICGEHGAAVESEPSEPEQEYADGRKRHGATGDRHHPAILGVFAKTRPEDHGTNERSPTTERVYEGRSREVIEAHRVEEAAAPFPGARYRVDESDEERREDHEGTELDSLCHGARDDRRGGRGEHRLEEEVGPVGIAAACVGGGVGTFFETSTESEAREAEEATEVAGIHEVKANDEVGENAAANDEGVFE